MLVDLAVRACGEGWKSKHEAVNAIIEMIKYASDSAKISFKLICQESVDKKWETKNECAKGLDKLLQDQY